MKMKRSTRNSVKQVLALLLVLVMLAGFLPGRVFAEGENALSVDKNEALPGEAVYVTASCGEEGATVGLYAAGEDPSGEDAPQAFFWYPVNGTVDGREWKNGEAANILEAIPTGRAGDGLLPGEYQILLLSGTGEVLASCLLNILEEAAAPETEELAAGPDEPTGEVPAEEDHAEEIDTPDSPAAGDEPVDPEEPAKSDEDEKEDEEVDVEVNELEIAPESLRAILAGGEELELMVNAADEDSPVGLWVSVSSSKVTVHANRVGSSGTAELYCCDADQYFPGDPLCGKSQNVNKDGLFLATYDCGAAEDFTFNRYRSNGADNLYRKYYLIQNDTILAGPVYASDISSFRNVEAFPVETKKGLTLEDASTFDMARDFGCSNTVINLDLGSMIFANEDANGNPIDNSSRGDVYEYESGGKTFYFDANYIKAEDGLISAYSKAGMNVTLVIITWANTDFSVYPTSLTYTTSNHQTVAFNTSNALGRDYFIAAMEFLAERYSRNTSIGLVDKFIIGNEIDYTYDWYLMEPEFDADGKYSWVPTDIFMEEYARTLRLANLAVKKYNAGAQVVVSLTHNWACARRDSYTSPIGNGSRVYNSYAPKEILDWLSTYEKARGDYDWAVSVHPYPIGTTSSNPLKTDRNYGSGVKSVNGDWRTSPWITAVNLELYQQYFEQQVNRYKGQVRSVVLTETCICNEKKENVSAADYKRSVCEQAASIAMYYYRAACIDCIKEVAYFEPHDQAPYRLGLMEQDGTHKPAYEVWKFVDTNLSFRYANKYLPYIKDAVPGAESYRDLMDVTDSGFDWTTKWDEGKIMPRTLTDSQINRSLVTDKTEYVGGDSIMVTAVGDLGDQVGLYFATDDPVTAEPIFSVGLKTTNNNVTVRSGKPFDLLAYGSVSSLREQDATLPAGNYQVALVRGDNGEILSVPISISGSYNFGSTDLTMKTDKDVYQMGEDVIVTATGPGPDTSWVGLYRQADTPGKINSIFWYYINNPSSGQISGKPTVLQSKQHNSDSGNPSLTLSSGTYVVYLFRDGGYNIVSSKTITVEPAGSIGSLKSVTYKLSNDTDGFANGVVTVTRPEGDEDIRECVMFWADEDGVPLEGYTALARFKLEGDVTRHEMYTHTIVPEGARKLIAYGSNGEALSEQPVSVDLPESCGYSLDEKPIVEFQIISDVHVTTDAGATNEVRLSNQHFSQMLEDVKLNSPESIGIFINGDIANTGSEAEYLKAYDLYNRSLNLNNGSLPKIHMAIGNHDWIKGNPDSQFQKYVKVFNPALPAQPEKIYYDEVVSGYHFIYLGGEKAGLHADMSAAQLAWFDGRMKEISEEDPDKPVFVFLHQSLYNTVAGSLPGQGWDGVSNETAFKNVLKKYGQIILVNGHSHWELNSLSCMYPGDELAPVALNTASVGYLWSSYNVVGGEFLAGSHGYYVRVFEDKVIFLGRDFENNLYIPSAIFVLDRNEVRTESEEYRVGLGSEALNLGAVSTEGGYLHYLSTDNAILNVTEDGTIIPKSVGEADVVVTAFGNDTTVISRKSVHISVADMSVVRYAGSNRFQTSFVVADAIKEREGVSKFNTVIVANGMKFADALSGSFLAYKKDAPILLVRDDEDDVANLRKYIEENVAEGGLIYVLGGEAAVPKYVLEGLEGFEIKRLAGNNRYLTNLEILREAGVENEDILVCTGGGFADSLSASAAMRPILLVDDALTPQQLKYLNTLEGGNKFYIIGGKNAVSEEIENKLKERGETTRLGGSTRYQTSVMVAETFFQHPASAVLAYSMNFPDGLCGGPLAMVMNGPLILTRTDDTQLAEEYTAKEGIKSGAILGGTGLISSTAASKVFHYDQSVIV